MDVLQEFFGIKFHSVLLGKPVYHLGDPFRPEGIFSVDNNDGTAETSVFPVHLDIYCKLVSHLRLSGTEFSVEFGNSLSFDTSTHHFIKFGATGGKFAYKLPSFKDEISGLKPPYISSLSCGINDFCGSRFPDFGCGCKFRRRRYSDCFNCVKSGFLEFFCSSRANSWQFFECYFAHYKFS